MTELRVVEDVVPLADPDVIETLERAMDQARKGDLVAVAVAVVHRDYGMQAHYHWGGAPSGMLLGSVDRLCHKLHADMDE